MASALATPTILAPSPIASCTALACPARARRPMTPWPSRRSALHWAPVPPAQRPSLSVALALTHRQQSPTLARPCRAPGRRTHGRRPASGSFRPRRCASPQAPSPPAACVATPEARLPTPTPNEGGLGGRLLPHGPRARLRSELRVRVLRQGRHRPRGQVLRCRLRGEVHRGRQLRSCRLPNRCSRQLRMDPGAGGTQPEAAASCRSLV